MTSTELRRREPAHQSSSHLSKLIGSAGALMVVAAFGAGCDTTAKISFPSRGFNEMHSTGMVAPAGSCGKLGTQGGATTKLRFAMVADDGTAIRPAIAGGTPLEGGQVTENDDLVKYSEAGRIYEHPDLQCTTGGNGGGNGNGTMTKGQAIQPFDGSCSSNLYSCKTGVSDGASWMKRCQKTSGYSVTGVDYVSDFENHQFFGVLAENAASLEGFPPVQSSYYDANGDGKAEEPIGYDPAWGSDPDGSRFTALKNLVPNWKNVRNSARAEDRQTFFGLWTFSGSRTPTSIVNEATSEETIWTQSADVADRATDESSGAYPSRTQQGSNGNVLEAAYSLITNQYTKESLQGMDKTLVLFADGPPEAHPDTTNVTTEKVIQAAQNADVRIFIVHLDEVIGKNPGQIESVWDDYNYYMDQSEQCGGPKDCRPHETCRTVRGYSSQRNGDVSGSAGKYHNQGEDATYCMPQRRQDGRTGPLSIYSRIACATQGGYQYVKTANDLAPAMSWLPYTMDGLWEADVNVEALSRGNYTANAPIRLQARFNVSVGDRTVNLDLTQNGGDEYEETVPGSGDARSVVVTGSK